MIRPRGKPIKVFVTEEEREKIAALAVSANLSLSAFLRAAGLNQRIRSRMNIHAVEELSKVNGELGRATAMLKLLVEDKRYTIARRESDRILKEFRELQKQTHEIMGRITR